MAVSGFKGIGWILGLATVSPACYMVSSMVAAERGRVESVDRAIGRARHDIRVLETEFQTRANMAQLERWNGDVLALSAPRPEQYISSEGGLASLRPLGDRAVRYAALVVPSAPAGLDEAAPVQTASLETPAAVAVASTVAASTVRTAVAHGKAQAVAMLDDKLLSDSTLGDLVSNARAGNGPPQVIVLVAPQAADRRRESGRHSMVAVAHARLMILMLLFVAGMTLIVARLGYLALSAEPATSRDAAAALVPLRGDIVDRNGAPLARTIDAWSIGVQPKNVIGDKAALATRLAELMPEQDATAYFRLLNAPVRFTYLKHRAMPALVAAVNALGDPGITFAREPERLYPQSGLAAQALGYLNVDRHGVRGMERALDDRLSNPALRGTPAALSIDLRVQGALESELFRAMTAFQAAGAAGVILDVHTGEVIAMSSLPSFNPNRVQAGEGGMLNNVTQSVYELGSAFKPITMAAAIDTGTVTSMARRFDATQPLQVGRFKIKDDHAQNRFLNIPETLIHSSNIATARIADELGEARLSAMFRKLGFDTAPDIEIEKSKPLWPKYWARTTTMTTAYGHGIAVTPLHLASAYAALVNGGIWRPATMLKVAPDHAARGRRVISEATSARLRQLLRLVVLQGTGRKGEAPGYRVGGKTGTAEKPGVGGYSKNMNVSTFAAAFPMDAPRYVVIAMLDSSKRVEANSFQTTAAYTAAPVVSRVIMRTGPLLGVNPDVNRDVDLSDILPVIWHAPGEKPSDAE